jgi:hypothetical protein
MTPKQKADELINKFRNHTWNGEDNLDNANAIKASIIAVDEIMKQFDGLHKPEYCAFDAIGERKFTFDSECSEHMTGYDMIAYWKLVKEEIEKI